MLAKKVNCFFFIVPDEVKGLKVTPVDEFETEKLNVSWSRPNGGVGTYSVSLFFQFYMNLNI